MERIKKQIKISIEFKWVAIIAYIILIVPILIFFFGWLKWYFAVLFSAIFLLGAVWMIKKDYLNNVDKIEIPVIHFLLILIVFWLWIAISGSSWLGDQTFNADAPCRNAILRDLIEYDWPVHFHENKEYGWCYYFVFWMIPALIGKMSSLMLAFAVQRVYLLAIVITSFLIITYILHDYHKSTLWTICLFIIFFSGLICIRNDFERIFQLPGGPAYYRSHQNLLGNTYNQMPMCLVAPLFMQNRKIYNFAFLGLLLLPYSPWATMGLALLMIIYAIQEAFAKNSILFVFRESLSLPNICSICSVLIVFGMFFSCNSTIVHESTTGIGNVFRFVLPENFDFNFIFETIIFWLSEFGVYYIFIWKKYKKDPVLWISLFLLMTFPFIWFGNTAWNDFASGASSPLLYILMIYIIGYFKDEIIYQKVALKIISLFICLAIAFSNPYYDIRNKIGGMIRNNSFVVKNDGFYTFSNKELSYDIFLENFLVEEPEETPFFKYLAKPFDKTPTISESLSEIKSITDIDDYFNYLVGKNCTIYISVQDIQGYSLKQSTIDRMKALGFDADLDVLMEREYHSFIGIVNNGQIVTEQIGRDENITFYNEIDGYPVAIESATLNAGNSSSITIKGKDYSLKGRGFNVVVIDNLTGYVIDSVAFDTHVDEIPCVRKDQ